MRVEQTEEDELVPGASGWTLKISDGGLFIFE